MRTRIVSALAAIILALFFADSFLASLERREVSSQAAALHKKGERLLDSGQAAAAVEPLRRAHTLVRDNAEFQLELARALGAAGRCEEAAGNLEQLLAADSNDGAVNLAMARLEVRCRLETGAEVYYHRAIYGNWPRGRPAEIRPELAELLARQGRQSALMAELLLMELEPSTMSKTRIGELFLAAGSPSRAAGAFRDAIGENRRDPLAYLGLGESQLASGNFQGARASLRTALRISPGDSAIAQQLSLAEATGDLDPAARGLTSAEKYARSARLLDLVMGEAAKCAPAGPSGLRESIDSAGRARKTARRHTNEAAESLIDAAEQLWRDENSGLRASLRELAGIPRPVENFA